VRGGRLSSVLLVAIFAAVLAFPAAARQRAVADGDGVAIFYYPWYSTPAHDGDWAHWYVTHDGSPTLATAFFPGRGLYSSSNAKVVDAHMRDIAAAGVDTVVVSWWGVGSPEDGRLPLVQQAARRRGLTVAIHLEPYRGRTPASAAADIQRLHAANGITDFYVYDADRDPASDWAAALDPLVGVRVFAQTTLVGRARAGGFDGLYPYDVVTWNGGLFRRLCTEAREAGLLCAPSVGPGYDARLATSDEAVRPRLQGATYDAMWKGALRSRPDLVTITSYNEWQEGTQIEPARPQVGRPGYDGAWGQTGVDARRAYLARTAYWADRFRNAPRQ
jgi:glycoprotein endo-alpha-1,2-mannosidase